MKPVKALVFAASYQDGLRTANSENLKPGEFDIISNPQAMRGRWVYDDTPLYFTPQFMDNPHAKQIEQLLSIAEQSTKKKQTK